jgi:hypothetical protein
MEANPNPTKALLVHLPTQLKLVIQMFSKGLKEIGGKATRNMLPFQEPLPVAARLLWAVFEHRRDNPCPARAQRSLNARLN